MSRMTPEQISSVLSAAIKAGHAVTLARGGRPFLAEPYALRQQQGKWILTFWNAHSNRIAQASLATLTDATDLGRPLDTIRPPEDEPESPKAAPGRPRVHVEPRRDLHIFLPEADVAAIERTGETLTDFVAAAVRERLGRVTNHVQSADR